MGCGVWDVGYRMWELRCEMWELRCGMWDVGYLYSINIISLPKNIVSKLAVTLLSVEMQKGLTSSRMHRQIFLPLG